MTRNADFKRRVRERMTRTGESYATARAQLLPTGTLHVTNGDITVGLLAEIGIEAMAWRDALHEGPVTGRTGARRVPRRRRGRVRGARPSAGRPPRRLRAVVRGRSVRPAPARRDPRAAAPRRGGDPLRQIGEHVGIAHFGGLGQLEPEQLRGLPAITLTPAALALGRQAWDALTAPEPSGLLAIPGSGELRFMAEAFKRLAQEYPWRRDGLSLSERRLLAGTPGTKLELFERMWRKEQRPFMGDTFAFARLDRLAPLLTHEGDVLHLNDAGERVLAGEAEFVTERWIGGVHVTPETPWRWDDGTETLQRR